MFEKFCGCIWKNCDIKNSVLSVFHPLRSVWHSPPPHTHTLFLMSHIIMLLLYMWILVHILLWSPTASFFYIYYSLSMPDWFFYLCKIFISVSGTNFRWVLNQACGFICELKEPPGGHVFIIPLLVMWKENNLSLGYRLHKKSPPSIGFCPFIALIFIFGFNGFPLRDNNADLDQIQMRRHRQTNVIQTFVVRWWEQLSAHIEFSSNWY